ncbi:type I secretion C-terminal target domain (VC_A0849 subclass), partial [Loktanella fryxellensis]
RLYGGSGNDRLFGGAGRDRIEGGTGRDVMSGGGDADQFVFAAKATATTLDRCDVITDFGRGDRLDLRQIDADTDTRANDAFTFHGMRAADNGIWYRTRGDDVVVMADVNGDGRADLSILLLDVDGITAQQFLL